MTQKPYLNLGCGRVILPAPKPAHYSLLDDGLTDYALWVNADRNAAPGVDCVVDLFAYPWPWEDNSFDGALLSHLVEHIPHEIRLSRLKWVDEYDIGMGITDEAKQLANMQDGWYAFFSELHRVLTPGAIAHILCPYAWSQGAVTDPTHTRLITEHTFTHSMAPDPNSPFKYATGGLHFEMVDSARFGVYPMFAHLVPQPTDTPEQQTHKTALFQEALQTRINVANDLAVKLRAIK